jgi:uncharacterized protein YdhG (YjbR/CyaY superfamily)
MAARNDPKGKTSATARDIDEYLATAPEDAKAALQKLRKIIMAAAPKATETISYQIPTFKHEGGLVGFAAFKNHCSLFVMSVSVMNAHKDLLKTYHTTKSAIHFTTDKPLPAALVTKLVKARIAENEAGRGRRAGGKQ